MAKVVRPSQSRRLSGVKREAACGDEAFLLRRFEPMVFEMN